MSPDQHWESYSTWTFNEQELLEFIDAIHPGLLKDRVEKLLRSENPKREDFTLDEAIRIGRANDTTRRQVPSVSRTLINHIFELDPECRKRFNQ